jgi:hypothetical protein
VSAERWRDAVVAGFCHAHAELRAANILETAQAARDTLRAFRVVATHAGDEKLVDDINAAISEADARCGELARAGARTWRRR